MRAFEAYGASAISAFAADGVTVNDLGDMAPLVQFEMLTLMTSGAISAADLRLVPTGRQRPQHSIEFDDLDAGLARLTACEHRTQDNPYHHL